MADARCAIPFIRPPVWVRLCALWPRSPSRRLLVYQGINHDGRVELLSVASTSYVLDNTRPEYYRDPWRLNSLHGYFFPLPQPDRPGVAQHAGSFVTDNAPADCAGLKTRFFSCPSAGRVRSTATSHLMVPWPPIPGVAVR